MILFVTLIYLAALGAALAVYIAYKDGLENIAPKREYKSGTIWCLWRWTKVESEYILRLHVFKTPWFAVCLHWIRKPDKEPWLHDHPVTFLSIILRGSYAELRGGYYQRLHLATRRRFNFIRASECDAHCIVFARKNTLTLALMGPKTREWGFHTPTGWVVWKDYYKLLKEGHDVRSKKYWEGVMLDRAEAALEVYGGFTAPRADLYKKVRW